MRPEYIKKDLAGYYYNAEYPPNYELYGDTYEGYKNNAELILFYEFAVQRYDVSFRYKGTPYYLMTDEFCVAVCDEHFTEQYEVFENANELIKHWRIDGKPLIDIMDELENVEPE